MLNICPELPTPETYAYTEKTNGNVFLFNEDKYRPQDHGKSDPSIMIIISSAFWRIDSNNLSTTQSKQMLQLRVFIPSRLNYSRILWHSMSSVAVRFNSSVMGYYSDRLVMYILCLKVQVMSKTQLNTSDYTLSERWCCPMIKSNNSHIDSHLIAGELLKNTCGSWFVCYSYWRIYFQNEVLGLVMFC